MSATLLQRSRVLHTVLLLCLLPCYKEAGCYIQSIFYVCYLATKKQGVTPPDKTYRILFFFTKDPDWGWLESSFFLVSRNTKQVTVSTSFDLFELFCVTKKASFRNFSSFLLNFVPYLRVSYLLFKLRTFYSTCVTFFELTTFFRGL